MPGKRHVQVHMSVNERKRGWCLKGSRRSLWLRRRGGLYGSTIEIHRASIGAEALPILRRKARKDDDDSLPVGKTKETRGRRSAVLPQGTHWTLKKLLLEVVQGRRESLRNTPRS